MAYIDFLALLPKPKNLDYFSRLPGPDKAADIRLAKQYGHDYWDGDRRHGFGGYRYDGRWRPVAQAMAEQYALKPGQRVLDIGCGRAFLLYELAQAVPGLCVTGVDASAYSVATAKSEVRPMLLQARAEQLPFTDGSFDLVLCLNTLQNLYCQDLEKALRELARVGRGKSYVNVESYRSEEEKVHLFCWTLTGECFFTPEEWNWWFALTRYEGDHSFTFFE